MVGVSGVMVAGVEVVVIGVNREGGQRRGEIFFYLYFSLSIRADAIKGCGF